MDFGKLFNVDRIPFELPPEDPRNASTLGTAPDNVRPRIHIGAPVWTCQKWAGKVFPRGTPARDYLSAYARQFNSIELNTTFYRIPEPAQVETWKNTVPADFKFAPKLPQSISHFGDYSAAKTALHRFFENIQGFGANLGLCFLQLPPHLEFRAWNALKRILKEVPVPSRLAVEFRHPSWFINGTLRPEAYTFLQSLGISTVITDTAGRRDVLHSSLTAPRVIIRFLGNELHPSDYQRIDDWSARITGWLKRGLEEVYFFIHQPTEVEVPEVARELANRLQERSGVTVRTWCPIEETQGAQEPQLSFF